MRRSPLRTKTRLARYTELRPRSKKKAKEHRESRPVVAEVLAADGGCVLREHRHLAGKCWGPLSGHHLRKQSAGGAWVHMNLVCACQTHQSWIEDNPNEAHRLGLVIRNGETNQSAWVRMAAARLPVRGGAA